MMRTAAVALAACAWACGGTSGGGGSTIGNRTTAIARACPAAAATVVARFDDHAGRWVLPLAGVSIQDPTGIEAYTTLDAAAAEAAHLPPPPATLWMDGRDGSWCKATPAAVYRALWNDGPTGLEYGVELDTACPPGNHRDEPRVAVAAPRPPIGCHAETTDTVVSSRTVEWDQAKSTFTPPGDEVSPRELASVWLAPSEPCTGACLALWQVDALSARGRPVAWAIVQTWITPDTTNLCSSRAGSEFEIVVARGSADGGGLAVVDSADEVRWSTKDPIAVLDDDGGPRVLVTGETGDDTTYEVAHPERPARTLRWGFPNEEDFAATHDLGPYCGP